MQTATQPRPEEPGPAPVPVREPAATGRGEDRVPEARPRRRGDRRQEPRQQRQLPLRARIILGTAGGVLVVLGIAGLFLPFLQGILFLLFAAAVLSLTSRRVYRWLQGTVGERWPNAWDRVERFRTRVRWRLRKK